MRKINNAPGKSSHRNPWLLIHRVQKLWTPLFHRQPLIWSSLLFIFFPNSQLLKIFISKHCRNEIQDKYTKKTHRIKLFLQNSITCLLWVTFLFLHAEIWLKIRSISVIIRSLKKSKYNCLGPPAFTNQRHWVGYESNKKLLHHYQLAKSQRNL